MYHRRIRKPDFSPAPKALNRTRLFGFGQRSSKSPNTGAWMAPATVESAMQSQGEPLPPVTRAFFEPRFGRDFSRVRVHTDQKADEANQQISARAFTAGDHIAFADGQYSPDTPDGRSLLAHELAHVAQTGASNVVRGDFIDDAKKSVEKVAEDVAKASLGRLANAPKGPASGFSGEPKCGTNFCQPFKSKAFALANLAWAGPLMLAGIAKKVNSRVVPLWASYLAAGSQPKNLSADFGKDFTASPTTADTTRYIVDALKKDVTANQTALMGGATTVTLDFTPRLSSALAAIGDPKQPIPPQMNFNIPADIAGNVAGGIGKDQTLFPIGARPSPFNDSRTATVKATLTRQADGSLSVTPFIRYTVKDTIDLCPGDCGTSLEQVATIPLSRFEATGVSGDVPMTIEFDAPASESAPFTISPPAPAPPPAPKTVTGTVTASRLRIREAASTASAIHGHYSKGETITLLCQTKGTFVDGVDTWYQTDKGFVSGRYVTLVGSAALATC